MGAICIGRVPVNNMQPLAAIAPNSGRPQRSGARRTSGCGVHTGLGALFHTCECRILQASHHVHLVPAIYLLPLSFMYGQQEFDLGDTCQYRLQEQETMRLVGRGLSIDYSTCTRLDKKNALLLPNLPRVEEWEHLAKLKPDWQISRGFQPEPHRCADNQ